MRACDIGIIGLGVMGQNLALNFERAGYTVAVFDRSAARVRDFTLFQQGRRIVGQPSAEELCARLRTPRVVLLMLPAGGRIDSTIEQLLPFLSPGDTIVDSGNSHHADTIRRSHRLERDGIHFLGVGVSGGEAGALSGASLMCGGSEAAWKAAGEMLMAIAARVSGSPCCAHLGPDGAGHYVMITHNGIEYGDMQLICEAYDLMTGAFGLSPDEASDIFIEWNRGELDSYLIEITADILSRHDDATGRPIVDVILDSAGQKGTGKWTSQQALELGIPAPTIAEAVLARYLSAQAQERRRAADLLTGPVRRLDIADIPAAIEDIRNALYASKVASYAQGFALMRAAAGECGWELDYGRIALIWRGGCIIRARFLDRIDEAFRRDPNLSNLMLDPFFAEALAGAQDGWRRTASRAAQAGIPAPALYSALAYYDGYRAARLPASLLQAQRDYFGGHTYKRIDREGSFHTDWSQTE